MMTHTPMLTLHLMQQFGIYWNAMWHKVNAICGSRELKMQIISEVKVEKMVIEVDVQMHDVASAVQRFSTHPGI